MAGVMIEHRRVGAHAAGVGPLVAVEHALVVLRRNHRDRGLAVAQREERRLLAFQEFLDHHLGAGVAETSIEHHVDGGLRLRQGLRHHHAFAGRKPIGLDHDRRTLRLHISLGTCSILEALIGRSRDAVVPAQVLGETLGGFQLGGRPARPERLDPGGCEIVHNTLAHRAFRPNDDEIDVIRSAERDHRLMVTGIEGGKLGLAGDPGITWGAKKPLHQRTRGDFPGQRMLAPAGADEKDVHAIVGFSLGRRWCIILPGRRNRTPVRAVPKGTGCKHEPLGTHVHRGSSGHSTDRPDHRPGGLGCQSRHHVRRPQERRRTAADHHRVRALGLDLARLSDRPPDRGVLHLRPRAWSWNRACSTASTTSSAA